MATEHSGVYGARQNPRQSKKAAGRKNLRALQRGRRYDASPSTREGDSHKTWPAATPPLFERKSLSEAVFLALAVGLSASPSESRADCVAFVTEQDIPFLIAEGESFTVEVDDECSNNGTHNNFGTLTNNGIILNRANFVNFAQFTNNAGAAFSNHIEGPAGFINHGVIDNFGTIGPADGREDGQLINEAFATVNNHGLFFSDLTNRGTFNNLASGEIAVKEDYHNTGTGTVNNSGDINVEAGSFQHDVLNNLIDGTITVGGAGAPGRPSPDARLNVGGLLPATFTNQGTVHIKDAGTLDNAGTLVNEAAGTITIHVGGLLKSNPFILPTSLINHGTITNRGKIENAADFDSDGTLTNYGSIENDSYFRNSGYGGGLLTNREYFHNRGGGGDFRNYARFENYRTFRNDSVFRNGFSLTNRSLVQNFGSFTNVGGSTLTNLETFNNYNYVNNFGAFNNGVYGSLNNSAGAIFQNLTGSTMLNLGVIRNSGGFNNFGTLTNRGNLTLYAGSSFDNTGGIMNNDDGGVIAAFIPFVLGDPASTINLNAGSRINSHATLSISSLQATPLDNRGTINSYGIFQNPGRLNNFGTLNFKPGSSLDNDTGIINNRPGGTINSHINFTLQGAGAGDFNRYAGSVFNNFATLGMVASRIDETFNNHGTLNPQNGLIVFGELNNLSLVNNNGGGSTITGALSNLGTLNNATSLTSSGAITNTGVLNNTGRITLDSMSTFDNAGGTINNSIGATFSNSTSVEIDTTFNNDGELSNSGDLTNTGALNNTGLIDNAGTLTLAAGSSFDNTGGTLTNRGILNSHIDLVLGSPAAGTIAIVSGSGEFNNHARLDNDTTQAPWFIHSKINNHGELNNTGQLNGVGTINNSGTLTNTGAMRVQTVNNSGSLILEWGSILEPFSGGTLNNNAEGVIDSHVDFTLSGGGGVQLNLNPDSEFNNHATIDAVNHTLSNGGVFNNAGSLLAGTQTGATGQLYNPGTINNTGYIYLRNRLHFNNTGGTLNNEAGGVIRSYLSLTLGGAAGTFNFRAGSEFNSIHGARLTNSGVQAVDGELSFTHFDNNGELVVNGILRNNFELTNRGRLLLNPGSTFVAGSRTINESGGVIDSHTAVDLSGSVQLAASSTFNNFGTATQAAGTSPFVNGGTFNNYDTLVNNGGIRNDSELNNVGHVTFNIDSSFFNADGSVFDNDGTLANNGTLFIGSGSTFRNSGDFRNAGVIRNDSTLDNTGTIHFDTGTGFIYTNGAIDNNPGGVINANVDLALDDPAIGTLNLNAGGQFNNFATLSVIATADNHGALDNHGTLNNNGALNNSGILSNHGALNNSGTFNNTGRVILKAGSALDNTGSTINNNAGGVIELRRGLSIGSGVSAAGLINLNTGSDFNNYAELNVDGTLINDGSLNNSATLNNNAFLLNSGTLQNDSTFNNNSFMSNRGTLTNADTLVNSDILINYNTLSNSSMLTNPGELLTDVGSTFDNTGDIYNSGRVSNQGILNNAGLLQNDDTLRNLGTINNSGTLSLTMASAFDNTGGVLNNDDGGTVNLHVALTLGSAAAGGTIVLNGGSTFNNYATLNSTDTQAVDGTLRNLGTIDNTGNLVLNPGAALDNAEGVFNNKLGGIVDANSDITLGGTVHLFRGGYFNNIDTVRNTATLSNDGFLNNYGMLDNAGLLTNTFVLRNSGVLNNTGTLNLNFPAFYNTGGTLNNDVGGVINSRIALTIGGAAFGAFNFNAGSELNNYSRLTNRGTLDQGGTLNNFDTLLSYGTLNNAGTLNNTGTLTLQPGSTFSNAGGVLYNRTGGTIESRVATILGGPAGGAAHFEAGGTFNNFGPLETHGALRNEGAMANFDTFRNRGAFSNDGTLRNTGTLENDGQLILGSGSTFENTGGVLNNNDGGVIDSHTEFSFDTVGGVVNFEPGSTFNNFATVTSASSRVNNGTFKNYGSFRNSGTLSNVGVLSLKAGSSFDNTGGILNNGDGGVVDSYVDIGLSDPSTGTINMNAGSELNNFATFRHDRFRTNNGTFNNAGTLLVTGGLYNYGALDNAGTVENTAYISSFGSLVNSGDLLNNAYLYNNGALSNTGSVTNSNYLSSDGPFINNGSVVNLGGATLRNDGPFENTATLENHSGATLGNYFSTITNSGQFVNHGEVGGFSSSMLLQTAGSTINNGSITQGIVDIRGGSISGSGTWDVGTLIVGPDANIDPGNSPGTMLVSGDFECNSCTVTFEFAGLGDGEYDVLDITGAVSFTGMSNVVFSFVGGFAPDEGAMFTFFKSATPVDFTSVLFSYAGLQDGFEFDVTAPVSGGLQFAALNAGAAAVPLPGSAPLLAGALLWLRGLLRRRRQPLVPATHPKFH